MNWKGKNGVTRPHLNETNGSTLPSFIQRMNQIDPVYIRVIFDREEEPIVELRTNNSARVLELLNTANLKTGYVVELKIMGESVGPRILTRLNYILSRTGWGEGTFRGWRRDLQKTCGVIWGNATAWLDLLSILGLEDI